MNSAAELILEWSQQVGAGQGADVPSPCLSVCRMDAATGWCEGCLRTLDEIAAWSRLDDDGKRGVWAELGERAARRLAQDLERS
jgi:predicted Fe-S protein YdhL (DUF1289 family)